MDQIGEMWGDRAIQAPFGAVLTRTSDIDGTKRTMFGGIIISDVGGDNWQRWRGTMILIPRIIDKERKPSGAQLQYMMLNWLGRETQNVKRPERDSFWKPEWRAPLTAGNPMQDDAR